MTTNTDASHELLPCPFCGGKVLARHALWPEDGCTDAIIHDTPWDCGMGEFSLDVIDAGVSTAKLWNTRSQDAHTGEKK